nr:hypothetical protein [Tanacetum cinerariifolium]
VEVVTTAKLITEVVATVSETVSSAAVVPAAITETISIAVVVPAAVTTAPVKVVVPSTRRRRGFFIRDPEEESSKASKMRRLNEEAKYVEELKQHLEIVPNEDDDVYT